MGTGLMLLTAYVLLALGLLINFGFYDPVALTLLLGSFGLLVASFVLVWKGSDRDRKVPGAPVFAIALLVLVTAAWFKPTAMYLQSPSYDRLYHLWLLVFAALIALAYLLVRSAGRPVRSAVFVLGVLVAVAFRVWMPSASPAPVIDTFSISQEASQFLLEGRNPYSTQVTDVYEGTSDLGYELGAYVYMPANLYPQVLSYLAAGDVRYVYVVAEIIAALLIWRLARRRWGDSTAECIALLFLYNPRSLFVVEQAWLDPLIVASFAIFLTLRDHRKPFAASLSYGYMLFLKPYMAFAAVQWLLVERSWKRLLAGLCVGVLTVLPFAVMDWQSLWENGVLFNVLIPFRGDGALAYRSLTSFTLVYDLTGLKPPTGWAVLVGALLTALTWIPQRQIQPLRGYLFAVTITLFGMFLFGSAGFCNWYYLVCGFMICLIAAGGRRRPADGSAETDPFGFMAA